GQSLVSLGLDLAAGLAGRRAPAAVGSQLAGLEVLVIGAGSMSALTIATAVRQGAPQVVVANRTASRAERLAREDGAGAVGWAHRPASIATADIVVTCTGAADYVLTQAIVGAAVSRRDAASPLVLLDLALPRDVEPAAGQLPGVALLDLAGIGAASGHDPLGGTGLASESDVEAGRRIVAQGLAAYLKAHRAKSVAPTVVALRAKAATVVEAELARLEGRLGNLDDRTRREIAQTMGRIADKLLHGPTVRVKELAGSPGGDGYENA